MTIQGVSQIPIILMKTKGGRSFNKNPKLLPLCAKNFFHTFLLILI